MCSKSGKQNCEIEKTKSKILKTFSEEDIPEPKETQKNVKFNGADENA